MINYSEQRLSSAFFLTQLKVLVLIAMGLLISDWAFNDRLDLWLADQMFDATTQQFPLKEHWFTVTIMHEWLKYLMVCLALGLIALLIQQTHSTRPLLSNTQIANLKIIISAAIILPLLIGTLKALSPIHCPWDLARYGGAASEFIWGSGSSGGKCFPAGHVTSTSWLMAFTFVYLPLAKQKARWVWLAAFSLAFMTGWVQQLRGAHFLCHTLWSLWISWAVIVLLAYYFRGQRRVLNRFAPA